MGISREAAQVREKCVPIIVSACPRVLVVRLEAVARRNNRTRSAEIRHALTLYVDRSAGGGLNAPE